MPRGGRRAGTPGRAYGNRTDLNATRSLPVEAAAGQPYGVRSQQEAAQRAVPVAPLPAARPPAPTSPPGAAPVGMLDFANPQSARPGEPVTAGARLGPGAGPEAIAAAGLGGDDVAEIRAMYQRFPSEELRQIIEELEEGGF